MRERERERERERARDREIETSIWLWPAQIQKGELKMALRVGECRKKSIIKIVITDGKQRKTCLIF